MSTCVELHNNSGVSVLAPLVFFGLPAGIFFAALSWTRPGPDQQRRCKVVFWLAIVLALIIVGIALAGIIDHQSKAPDTGWFASEDDNYYLLALLSPLIITDVAIFTSLRGTNESLSVRAGVSLAVAVVFGVPAASVAFALLIRLTGLFFSVRVVANLPG